MAWPLYLKDYGYDYDKKNFIQSRSLKLHKYTHFGHTVVAKII